METKIIAIVPAAGLGKRFDTSGKKTFVDLDGTPLLVHTLKRLQRDESIHEIVPVLRQEYINFGFDLAREYAISKIKRIAPGGNERQDSIYNALKLICEDGEDACNNIIVLIHDGARPIIPTGTVERLVEQLKHVDGAAPGIKPKDTLKEVSDNEIISATIDRDRVRAIQTPQAFALTMIKKAYDTAYSEGYYATDDAALVESIGGRVKIIEGSPYNIKITTPEDIDMVKHILLKELISS